MSKLIAYDNECVIDENELISMERWMSYHAISGSH